MRKLLCLLLSLACFSGLFAQQDRMIDSLQNVLNKTTEPAARVELLGILARVATNSGMQRSDSFGQVLTREAELSRDRRLIVKALLINGERYGYLQGNRQYISKAISYYQEAYTLARREKLDKETASALIHLTSAHLSLPDVDKAFSFAGQALGIVSPMGNDSLKVQAYIVYGDCYLAKKERILALRNFLSALRLAEQNKEQELMRGCYGRLRSFYAGVSEYDKAIDYARKAYDLIPQLKEANAGYYRPVDLYEMAMLYVRKRNFTMADYYFDLSLRAADSLKYPPLKIPAYNGLLNRYLLAEQPKEALAFFNRRPEIKQFALQFGMGHQIDLMYAAIYSDLKQFDSARLYFMRAAPGMENSGTLSTRMQFPYLYADYLTKAGRLPDAIETYRRALSLADSATSLDWQKRIAHDLDSVYALAGDFRQAHHFKGLYQKYSDSLKKLSEEKDLLQMELDDEQERERRRQAEAAVALERKHTLQYMGITVGIGVVFVLLVLMGILSVSEAAIKVMGFFSFIFLFEFIILIADNKIHHATHGEPLKVLGIKVLLIAVLLPLHHWMEHKVVHYIASRKLQEAAGKVGIARFLRRKKVSEGS